MPVRAVTPRVVAISGHVQIHGASCAGDCCNYDTFTDALATGDDIYDPEEWPHRPLRLKPTRGGHVRPTTPRRGHTPMHESADHRVGLDGRSALSPSSALGGSGAERSSERSLAAGALDHPDSARAHPSSGARAESDHFEDVGPAGGNRQDR